jgi:hypothetical protein
MKIVGVSEYVCYKTGRRLLVRTPATAPESRAQKKFRYYNGTFKYIFSQTYKVGHTAYAALQDLIGVFNYLSITQTSKIHRHQFAYTRLLHGYSINHIYSTHRLFIVRNNNKL